MRQYAEIKAKYPGAILLFRVGDFYETFGEDAVRASEVLNITLTKRSNGKASEVALAGFPHHSLDTYLPRLVRAGHRVAICDQLEDPKATKKLVERGVTELVTPGLSSNDQTLQGKQANYLSAIYEDHDTVGAAFVDLSTGAFYVVEGTQMQVERMVRSLHPAEIVVSKAYREKFDRLYGEDFYSYSLDKWFFEEDFAEQQLLQHFKMDSLRGFGIDHMKSGIVAAGAVMHYLNQTHHTDLEHINQISRIDHQDFVWIDAFTIRNLEVLQSNHSTGIGLLDVLDCTCSPMGSRLLKNWLVLPLMDLVEIKKRLDTVEYLLIDKGLHQKVRDHIKQVGDLERLISKVALKRIQPRELISLATSLKHTAKIQALCKQVESRPLELLASDLAPPMEVVDIIESHISEDAPAVFSKGGVFKKGINQELDDLLDISKNGKDYLLDLKNKEAERTGISSLKLAYNNVFGYYLEVTHTHKDKVPEDWIRKQTLVNAERYITPELKEYEEKILHAEEKISKLETVLYEELTLRLSAHIARIQNNARTLARLDCLASFAEVALQNNYCKPEVDDSHKLILLDCRHPVIEQQLPLGESYIPNDIYLDKVEQQVIVLTGPNMSGKSAVLRQTALAVLMAQMGSFVPARHAQIGLVDKIYTRVGASDNISQGESTFMVEMVETASILNNLSDRSLIILDEIGRGTSTFDGVSLAWSIAEFLAGHDTRPKTLFATHYHEMNELEAKFENIVNYHIRTEEKKNKVIFLRKMKKGGSEHSFGIHVARMAGIPRTVVRRADHILKQLESDRSQINSKQRLKQVAPDPFQLNLFQLNDSKASEVIQHISKIEIDSMTPVEALMKLHEIKKILED